jgi:hypothetical protein
MQAGDTEHDAFMRVVEICQAALDTLREFQCEDVDKYQKELDELTLTD